MLDVKSGAKLLLQLPATASRGTALDIAVTPTRVAVVGGDRSVSVFEVPLEWEVDDPPCGAGLHFSPGLVSVENADTGSLGPVQRVEWVRKDGQECLAIGGDQGVIVVSPDRYRGKTNMDMTKLVKEHKLLKTQGVSDLILGVADTSSGRDLLQSQPFSHGYRPIVCFVTLYAIQGLYVESGVASSATDRCTVDSPVLPSILRV